MKTMPEMPRRLGALVLSAAVLWAVFTTAGSSDAASALRMLEDGLPILLLRQALGDHGQPWGPAALAISQSPLLSGGQQAVLELRSREEVDDPADEPPEVQTPVREEPVSPAPPVSTPLVQVDNGVPARTLVPNDPSEYVVSGLAYVSNASKYALTPQELAGDYLHLGQGEPQVLILHTHGSEAYTMPPGEAYESVGGDCRTTDTAYNVVRVGDEIAAALAERGISVVHDRGIYDEPEYSGAYTRSLASAENYMEKYPSIRFILDVHRDAITDSSGTVYKVISETDRGRAAQMTFVMGSSGSGSPHEAWRDNLRLAAALQNQLLERYPTLMRPIILRNSRYNQHCTTGSLLVEVGAAGNSLDEALVSARLLAEAFADVVQ